MPQDEELSDSSGFGCLGKVVIVVLALFNIWHLAVEHAERREKKELSQIKAELLAEVRSLKDRLDAQLLRQAEAKSNFDLFNEQFIRSREPDK